MGIEDLASIPFEPDSQFNQILIFPDEGDLHGPARVDRKLDGPISRKGDIVILEKAVRGEIKKGPELVMHIL